MDMKKNFICLIIYYVIGIAIADDAKCPAFACKDNLPTGKCGQENTDKDVISYFLQRCPKGQECSFRREPTSNCVDEKKTPIPLYPGSKCTDNKDCFSGNCKSGVCTGIEKGEVCLDHTDCSHGQGCIMDDTKKSKICQNLIADDKTKCTTDYDCVRTMGCNNGQCTKYFSLVDDSVLTAKARDREWLPISLCKSGIEIEGKCASLKRTNTDCTADGICQYQRNGNTTNIYKSTDFCQCGYNTKGTKHCKVGSDEKSMTDFIANVLNFLESTTNCNTMERNTQCNDYRKYPTNVMGELGQNFTNNYKVASEFHMYEESDPCAKYVTIPDYKDWDIVQDKTCPIYKCEAASGNCALSNFFKTEDRNHVSLDEKVCKAGQYCGTDGNPWEIFASSETSVSGKCKPLAEPFTSKRLPGEKCDDNNQCQDTPCKDGVCPGKNAGEACSGHSQCVVGTYCKDKTTCTAQLGNTAACTNSLECQNNLVCLTGTCQAGYYSQKAGVKIEPQEGFTMESLCEYGKYDNTNKECTILKLKNTKNTDGFALCDYGTQCQYSYNDKVDIPMPCECGYNEKGQGYCRPGQETKGKIFFNSR
jgi:hypothetical protein